MVKLVSFRLMLICLWAAISCAFCPLDVDNLQVLGFGSGHDEEEAFEDFVSKTKWLSSTKFRRVISIEVKHPIEQGKSFMLP